MNDFPFYLANSWVFGAVVARVLLILAEAGYHPTLAGGVTAF